MQRSYYLDLAARGLRMPVGTDLVLHEQPDPEAIRLDGARLGRVIEQAARRYATPLAFPLMDLRLEKADLLGAFEVPEAEVDGFHFDRTPPVIPLTHRFAARNQAHIDAVRYVAGIGGLLPIGMAIGPFSLSTKLMADPIMAVATGDEMAACCLALAERAVQRSVAAQIAAGARAVLICEPAANIVYISPRQVERGSDIFERFVIAPNLRLKALMEAAEVDLIFHDCGELAPFMVSEFAARLRPVILSFGSSRKLWEDAALVAKDIVLYGNLPTRQFYSDAAMPLERVVDLTRELTARMREAGHPHILGSECDVLHVPEAAETIRRKVEAMLAA
ncbi:MAG: uroporphyrinogen decarboxylase family protein [Bryobacteraceae bacterium]